MMIQFLAAFIGTAAFALLFGVEKEYYFYCGLIGGIGRIFYVWLTGSFAITESTFFTTLVIIFLSRFFAVRKKCPSTIFVVSGILPLVPGAGIYWMAYYFVINKIELASKNGFSALKIAVAIVLGIVFIFELPQKIFTVGLKENR